MNMQVLMQTWAASFWLNNEYASANADNLGSIILAE